MRISDWSSDVCSSDLEVRATRRHKELIDKGENPTYDQVLADLRRRDAQDQARETAPLKPAGDAHLLDTSDLDIEAAVQAAQDIVAAVLDRKSTRLNSSH